jgi:hypothetical protein
LDFYAGDCSNGTVVNSIVDDVLKK